MIDLDPQTTADFWDAYIRAVGADTYPAQPGHVPEISTATIKFAWDLVLMSTPIAAAAPPSAA